MSVSISIMWHKLYRKILLWLVVCLVLGSLTSCTDLFFYPQKKYLLTPTELGLNWEEIEMPARDGTSLRLWLLKSDTPPKATMLYLHGNAENMSTHIGSVYWLPAKGYDVLLLDYRGYGDSGGTPKLKPILGDIDDVLAFMINDARVRNKKIVVFGQSLGGALAISTVANTTLKPNICALIAESSFSSYRSIVQEKIAHFWITWPFQIPLSSTIDTTYDPLKAIAKISPIPLLLLHSTNDPIVPYHHSKKLFDQAGTPKDLWEVQGAQHAGALADENYRLKFVEYLSKHCK